MNDTLLAPNPNRAHISSAEAETIASQVQHYREVGLAESASARRTALEMVRGLDLPNLTAHCLYHKNFSKFDQFQQTQLHQTILFLRESEAFAHTFVAHEIGLRTDQGRSERLQQIHDWLKEKRRHERTEVFDQVVNLLVKQLKPEEQLEIHKQLNNNREKAFQKLAQILESSLRNSPETAVSLAVILSRGDGNFGQWFQRVQEQMLQLERFALALEVVDFGIDNMQTRMLGAGAQLGWFDTGQALVALYTISSNRFLEELEERNKFLVEVKNRLEETAAALHIIGRKAQDIHERKVALELESRRAKQEEERAKVAHLLSGIPLRILEELAKRCEAFNQVRSPDFVFRSAFDDVDTKIEMVEAFVELLLESGHESMELEQLLLGASNPDRADVAPNGALRDWLEAIRQAKQNPGAGVLNSAVSATTDSPPGQNLRAELESIARKNSENSSLQSAGDARVRTLNLEDGACLKLAAEKAGWEIPVSVTPTKLVDFRESFMAKSNNGSLTSGRAELGMIRISRLRPEERN